MENTAKKCRNIVEARQRFGFQLPTEPVGRPLYFAFTDNAIREDPWLGRQRVYFEDQCPRVTDPS